jgi:glycosyltransferase involved in cell wall biosynthesis
MDSLRAKVTKTILIGTSLRDLPIQRHFAALASELVSSDYLVALIIHGPADKSVVDDSRLSVLNWPSIRPTGFADMVFFDRLVRRLKPCCLISNFGARNIMMTIGGLRRVPVRIHWHHTLSTQVKEDWRNSHLKLSLLKLRARIPFNFVTHVVANSNAAKEDVVNTFGVPPQKCQVFWNALADPWCQPDIVQTQEANNSDFHRFVCVGRFAASKGQDVLLKAMAQMAPQHPEAIVEFIGDGATRARCEELARQLGLKERCYFVGALPHPEVLSRMATASAVVVPSRNEAFGLVNIESMSLGVPVIGSNTGGIAEIVRDGIDGFLFPPGDHDALAARMIMLLENQPLRAKMAISARRRFLEHFESVRAVKEQALWIIEQIRKAENGRLDSNVKATAADN